MSRTTRALYTASWIQSEQHFINREVASHNAYLCAIGNGAHSYWSRKVWKEPDFDPEAAARNDIARWTRDGRDGLTETKRNTGYKTDSKKKIRRLNKEFCRRAVADQDTDDIPHAILKDGKTYKWDWW